MTRESDRPPPTAAEVLYALASLGALVLADVAKSAKHDERVRDIRDALRLRKEPRPR